MRKMERGLRIGINTPVETSRTDEMVDTIWLGDNLPPKCASTTTTNVPDNIMVNYRATIVPDGTGNVYGKDGRSSVWEAVRWIKDYAEVNGVQDLKDAVGVIEEKLESIL